MHVWHSRNLDSQNLDIQNLECLSKCLQATKFRKRFGGLTVLTECSCASSRWRYSESHISQVRNSCTDEGSGVSFCPNFVQPLNFPPPFSFPTLPTPPLPSPPLLPFSLPFPFSFPPPAFLLLSFSSHPFPVPLYHYSTT